MEIESPKPPGYWRSTRTMRSGCGIRQRLEYHRVDDRKNGRVGADLQAPGRANRNSREAGGCTSSCAMHNGYRLSEVHHCAYAISTLAVSPKVAIFSNWFWTGRWHANCSNHSVMPEKRTIERAREDAREGKSPSTQAGEFVREEMDHIREGKHGCPGRRSRQSPSGSRKRAAQGTQLAAAESPGTTPESTERQAKRDLAKEAARRRQRKSPPSGHAPSAPR